MDRPKHLGDETTTSLNSRGSLGSAVESASSVKDASSPNGFLMLILGTVLRPLIRRGNVNLHIGNPKADFVLGDGDGAPLDVYIARLPSLLRILANPGLAVGETFVEGDWDIDEPDISRFISCLLLNEKRLEATAAVRVLNWLRDPGKAQANTSAQSRRNAAHHYDLGNDLYETFLDEEMVYSCAFFSDPAQSLEAAQKNKLEITLERLKLDAGMHVLDVGCGWGALTRAIGYRNASAVGITLADQQLAYAQQHLPPELRDRITYQLEDYRDHAGQNPQAYDRVVSVGMFEHVGRAHFAEYFSAIFRMLKPGGRAVIHSIIKPSQSATNAWIIKYIFPGGLIPQISDMSEAAKTAGLLLPHEPFIHEGDQYATTLRHWRKRFNSNWGSLDPHRYDARFRRLWNFYLAGSEAAFETLGYEVAQIVVEKPQ